MLNPKQTINCRGHLLDLSEGLVMGILNITPDSFHDGGRFDQLDLAMKQVGKMLEEGADIIDVGGMSSRPGAEIITIEEELKRVLPVIEKIKSTYPEAIISIDTVHSEVAIKAVESGASMINDISAGNIDEGMFDAVAKLNLPYVLMHMKGQPKDMQDQPIYDDLMIEIMDFFIEKVGVLRDLKVKDIILDVGFGFGKSIDDNYDLLKNMHAFQILDLPVLAGLSRKSMIYKYLEIDTEEALNGTTALHMVALQQGARILRVHDVKEAVQTIQLWRKLSSL